MISGPADAASAETGKVITTYLQIPDRSAFRPAYVEDERLSIIEAHEPSVPFNRFLYATVGEPFAWTDRLKWSDEQLLDYLSRPEVRLFGLYLSGTPIGYLELDADPDEESEAGTEVAYLGIFPGYHGRGYGKHLLSFGVTQAFKDGASGVWLHTCTMDGPHALANYRARGFVSFRVDIEDLPPQPPA